MSILAPYLAEIQRLRKALARIAEEPGCGCSPICRCNSEEALMIQLEEIRDEATEVLNKTVTGVYDR